MKTSLGHLTYCSNIHPGKDWDEDFKALQDNFPDIKQAVSPRQPMGLGLRLSHIASKALMSADRLDAFKQWLEDNDAYVFTMNGFPYGDFHRTVVKAEVHSPDWTTDERRDYTIRLFHILRELLPEGMDGGISTSPLSYRHWFNEGTSLAEAKTRATRNILEVVKELIRIERQTSICMHLDVEPEPDGILETGREFIDWFEQYLLRLGVTEVTNSFDVDAAEAERLIKRHVCLCYDVCHFAIGYENHQEVLDELKSKGIQVGKIQISAALQAQFDVAGRAQIKKDFERFNEPTYLHQVVALTSTGERLRYPDLPEALEDFDNPEVCQWRAHFHIPIAVKDFSSLQSTQEDIVALLKLQHEQPFTLHLEVETYTWEILPEQLKLPIAESISQELNWVVDQLDQFTKKSSA